MLRPATPPRPVTQIALAHGFSNLAHFSRVFKSRYGMPPSDYRDHTRRLLGEATP